MAVTNFLTNTLPDYVANNREMIIGSFALSGDSRKYMGLMTGVKMKAQLNYFNANIVLQDGSVCGFEPLDSLLLSAKTIEAAPIKVQGEICPQTLLGKWPEYLVRLNAKEIKEDLPFEAFLVEAVTNQIKKDIEYIIWKGDPDDGDPIPGILKQLPQEAFQKIDCCAGGCNANTPNVFSALTFIYSSLDEDIASKGVDIFVDPKLFRALSVQLMKANLYHFAPEAGYPETIILPGTDARVIKTEGLATTSLAVVTFRGNFVYATDMEGDEEVFDIWWSNDARKFRYEVLWTSGVGIYFDSMVAAYELSCTGEETVDPML